MDNYTMTLTSAAAARPCVLARPWMTSDDASGMSTAGLGIAGPRNASWSGIAASAQGNAYATNRSAAQHTTFTTQIVRDHAAAAAPQGVKSVPPPRGVPR